MLAQCPNCHTKISSRSIQCPNCHGPLRQQRQDMAWKVFGWTFALFNVLMLVWLVLYMTTGRLSVYSPRIQDGGDLAGAPVGGGMGIGFVFLLWAMGLLILGICAVFNMAHQAGSQQATSRSGR